MALVIAVIVLLILAGVSINFIFGNEGILSKAQIAALKYENAQEEEKTEIAKYSNEIDSYVDGNRATFKAKSLIKTNDILYNTTDNGFIIDTPTTYTDMNSSNYYINLNDNYTNYDYLIIDYDTFQTFGNTYAWGTCQMIPTGVNNFFIYGSNLADTQYLNIILTDNNKLKIGSAQGSTHSTKIRIIDIKGIKL